MTGTPKFPLGQVVATPGALELLGRAGVNPASLLSRHVRGDWGLVGREDAQANEHALRTGARLLSVYEVGEPPERVWIITEADRSSTCLLRPDEY